MIYLFGLADREMLGNGNYFRKFRDNFATELHCFTPIPARFAPMQFMAWRWRIGRLVVVVDYNVDNQIYHQMPSPAVNYYTYQ